MAYHRKHSKAQHSADAAEPADALRRDAGPAPDFELVRPYVASLGEEPPAAGSPAAPVDATAELTLHLLTVGQRPAVPDAPERPTRRRRSVFLLLAAAVVVLLVAIGVLVFRATPSAPAIASGPPLAPASPTSTPTTVETSTAEPSPAPPTATTTTSTAASATATTGTTTTNNGASRPSPSATSSPLPATQPSPAAAPVTGQLVGIGGMCVDDNGRISNNGTAIQLYGCNGTPAQVWTFQNGTLQVLGKCMQVTQPASGGLTELWDCNGSPTEAWRAGPNNTWINVATGLCLDDPNLTLNQGTQLQIWQCNGGTNQSWSFQ